MDFQEHLEQRLKDPKFREAYEELGPMYEIIHSILALHTEKKWTDEHYFAAIFQLHDEIRDYLAELDWDSRALQEAREAGGEFVTLEELQDEFL